MLKNIFIQSLLIAALALCAGLLHRALHKPLDLSFTIHPAPPTVPPVNQQQTSVPNPPTPAPKDDSMISLDRFREMMNSPLQIIDAREPHDFAKAHIPNAYNIPMSAFFSGLPDLVTNNIISRDLPIVVYCGGGDCDASRYVAKRLKDLGFSQMFVYEDGFTGWTKATPPLPVETNP